MPPIILLYSNKLCCTLQNTSRTNSLIPNDMFLLVEKAKLSSQNVLILFKKQNFKFNYIFFVRTPSKLYDFSSNNIIVEQNHQVVMSVFDSSNKMGYTSQILYYIQSRYNTFVSFLVLVFGVCIVTEPSLIINIFLHMHRTYSSTINY